MCNKAGLEFCAKCRELLITLINTESLYCLVLLTGGSGIITTAKLLDHEHQDFYNLTIKAEDAGSPVKLSSHANVLIHVTDVNDNKPR